MTEGKITDLLDKKICGVVFDQSEGLTLHFFGGACLKIMDAKCKARIMVIPANNPPDLRAGWAR